MPLSRDAFTAALLAGSIASFGCVAHASSPPTPTSPAKLVVSASWSVEAGAMSCPAPPATDGGQPPLVIRARADTPWLEVVRTLDQCRARWALRSYAFELVGPAPQTSRPLTMHRSSERGVGPPVAGAPRDPNAPRLISAEITRDGATFVSGRRVDAAALAAAIKPEPAGGAVVAMLGADGEVHFARVLDLLTKLQARGADVQLVEKVRAP